MVTDAAASTAAMLTASAFGLGNWCFVAPTDCGLGLFARSALRRGQAICTYDGPRLPLEAISKGEYALEVPSSSGLVIDGVRENCLSCVGVGPPCPAVYANHSSQPNARLEHWPASGCELDRLVLVASEPIPAGREVRFDYEKGARKGTYWRGRGGRPVERLADAQTSSWRMRSSLPTPPPTCHEPVVDQLPRLLKSARDSAISSAATDLALPAHQPPWHAQGLGTATAAAEFEFEGGEVEKAAGLAAFESHRPSSPVAWEGPRGGDAVLAAIIAILQPSEWLQHTMRKSDGKAHMWEVVATHLPGRTPAECQERWRVLSRSRVRGGSAAAAAPAAASQACDPADESVWFARPRGRPPVGSNGESKRWCHSTGVWIEESPAMGQLEMAEAKKEEAEAADQGVAMVAAREAESADEEEIEGKRMRF